MQPAHIRMMMRWVGVESGWTNRRPCMWDLIGKKNMFFISFFYLFSYLGLEALSKRPGPSIILRLLFDYIHSICTWPGESFSFFMFSFFLLFFSSPFSIYLIPTFYFPLFFILLILSIHIYLFFLSLYLSFFLSESHVGILIHLFP